MTEKEVNKLIKIISQLRDPLKGCPWDIMQTHTSLIPYVLEEAHEVADAIRNGNDNELCEELGDLLFQVLLHAQIAEEEKRFNLEDIFQTLRKKLIRRHPHVFSKVNSLNIEDLKRNWEEIKSKEIPQTQSISPVSDALANKVRSQPAFSAAMLISKKTARIGFEWDSFNELWKKVIEELKELKEAVDSTDKKNIEEELGDLLFTLVNVGRWYDINPEESLSKTNKKFLDRFRIVESSSTKKISEQSVKKLNRLWQQAKNQLNKMKKDQKS